MFCFMLHLQHHPIDQKFKRKELSHSIRTPLNKKKQFKKIPQKNQNKKAFEISASKKN